MTARAELNSWILARKAEGYWVTPCGGPCGVWFAQIHRGRRAVFCGRQMCEQYRRWRMTHGRAPPAWMLAMWREKYGDTLRTDKPRLAAPQSPTRPRREDWVDPVEPQGLSFFTQNRLSSPEPRRRSASEE